MWSVVAAKLWLHRAAPTARGAPAQGGLVLIYVYQKATEHTASATTHRN